MQRETGVTFVVSPQFPDVRLVAEETDLAVMGQRADASDPGRGMGQVLPATLAAAGADALALILSDTSEATVRWSVRPGTSR